MFLEEVVGGSCGIVALTSYLSKQVQTLQNKHDGPGAGLLLFPQYKTIKYLAICSVKVIS